MLTYRSWRQLLSALLQPHSCRGSCEPQRCSTALSFTVRLRFSCMFSQDQTHHTKSGPRGRINLLSAPWLLVSHDVSSSARPFELAAFLAQSVHGGGRALPLPRHALNEVFGRSASPHPSPPVTVCALPEAVRWSSDVRRVLFSALLQRDNCSAHNPHKALIS